MNNMGHKNIISIFILICIIPFFITACKGNTDNLIFKDNNEVKYVQMQNGCYCKIITKPYDIKLLENLIYNIELLEYNQNKQTSLNKGNDIFRIKFFNAYNEIVNIISFNNNKAYYNNKWFDIDPENIIKLNNAYERMGYEEYVDKLEKSRLEQQLARKELPAKEALIGNWLYENGDNIHFNASHLTQENNHIFKYIIEKEKDKSMHISVYGTSGIFVKNKKLFDLFIEMDSTKCHMKITKVMGNSEYIFYDNLVYLNENNTEIGTFDSIYFSDDF